MRRASSPAASHVTRIASASIPIKVIPVDNRAGPPSNKSKKRYGIIAGTSGDAIPTKSVCSSNNLATGTQYFTLQRLSSVLSVHHRDPQVMRRPTRPRGRVPVEFLAPELENALPTKPRHPLSHTDIKPRAEFFLTPGSSPLGNLLQPHKIRSVAASPPSPSLMHSSSSLSLSPPQRTLRRKQRMTLLKQKSSRSLRAHASAPLLNINRNRDSSTGNGTRLLAQPVPTHVSTPVPSLTPMPIPQAPPTVRLGHPSRPYYTAIRPNMSRPNSPSPRTSPSTSRAPSPSFSRTSAHILHAPNLAQSSFRSSYPNTGFSLSGETELRMRLARFRSASGVEDASHDAEPSEYRFREMPAGNGKVRSPGKGSRSAKFGGKMKRFGMGILELVLGRK